jgi:leader peptidase (prepilin peptidase)/N-methyltransferase
MLRIVVTTFAGLLGLDFGSFLNVCLTRWPAGESVVAPRSHCRNCAHTLAWWENVPLVSWIGLRGRCRSCGEWIGWRYPLVEFLLGMLWAYLAWQSSNSIPALEFPFQIFFHVEPFLFQAILVWFLVALAALDAENLWLPNWLTYPGIALGVVEKVVLGVLLSLQPHNDTVGTTALKLAGGAILSAAIAALLILLIRWVYWLLRRREGMGLGDAKLMALLAAWLGLPGALLAFALGVVLGAVIAVIQLAVPSSRAEGERWSLGKLPLGTFLCVGGIVSSLWGQQILAAYYKFAGL